MWFWFRYGEIVKTHILGCPCVMLASPEAAWFVLVTQAHLFKPTYPPSKEQLIGRWALFFHQGSYHLQMRKLVQGSLSLDVIRNLVPDIGAIAAACLESWSGGHVISTFHELKKVSLIRSICWWVCRGCRLRLSVLLVTYVTLSSEGWVSSINCCIYHVWMLI